MKASDVKAAIKELGDSQKATFLLRFFKTGPGEYAEGDIFAGLTVPQSRKISKEFKSLSLSELTKLITSKIHEERLVALMILVAQYKKGNDTEKKAIVDLYVKNLIFVNNWDLVDGSAPYILGDWLLERDRAILYKLAKSKVLWERRVAIMSTFAFIYAGEYKDTFAIAEILIQDKHDLIHKAVGWMLREVGKHVDMEHLRNFLKEHASSLPRTALRYAIEKMPEMERKKWLSYKKGK